MLKAELFAGEVYPRTFVVVVGDEIFGQLYKAEKKRVFIHLFQVAWRPTDQSREESFGGRALSSRP